MSNSSIDESTKASATQVKPSQSDLAPTLLAQKLYAHGLALEEKMAAAAKAAVTANEMAGKNTAPTLAEAANLSVEVVNELKDFREQLLTLTHSAILPLQKIGELAGRMPNPPWSLRQFLNLLVPLERFLQRQVTDADLIHDLPDKASESSYSKNSLILIADNIRSAFNVGAFFRCADAFALTKILLTGYSPTPDHVSVSKTALGSETYTEWQHFDRCEDAIKMVKNLGYQLVALETTPRSQNIFNCQLPDKMAILVGNERFGLNTEFLTQADKLISIPMLGRKNSLNVATSFSLLTYEWQRQHLKVK